MLTSLFNAILVCHGTIPVLKIINCPLVQDTNLIKPVGNPFRGSVVIM